MRRASARATATAPYGRYDNGHWTVAQPHTKYQAAMEDYVDKFRSLVKKWRAETLWCSFVTEAIEHEAFQEILALAETHGDEIIRLIVEEIEIQPDFLIAALPILTGQDPVRDSDRGNLSAMAYAWAQWYRNR